MTYRTEQIEDAIEHTRSRIDSRLDQLSDKLSPSGFLSDVLGEEGEPASNIGASLIRKARENPFSALLIGAGLAGFFVANRTRANGQQHADRETPDGGIHDDVWMSSDPAERVGQRANKLKNQAADMRHGLTDSVEDFNQAAKDGLEIARRSVEKSFDNVSEKVAGMAEKTVEAVSETSSQAQERGRQYADKIHAGANSAGHAVRKQADRSRDGVESAANWVRDNPIPAGLMALAAGAAAASILVAKRPVNGQSDNAPSAEDEVSDKLKADARQREFEPVRKVGDRVVDLQAEAEVSGATNGGVDRDNKSAAQTFPGAAMTMKDTATSTGRPSAPEKVRSSKKVSTMPKGVSSKTVGAD